MNLGRGYDSDSDSDSDSDKTRPALAEFGFTGEIARKGVAAPIQPGKWRVVVEQGSHTWMNGFGKLRRCAKKRGLYLYLSAAIVAMRTSAARPRAAAGTTDPSSNA